MAKWLNPRPVSQEMWALFPAPLERSIMFAAGSAQGDPHSYTAGALPVQGVTNTICRDHSILA